jgi:ribonuclease HI
VTDGFKGAKYKSFEDYYEAAAYLNEEQKKVSKTATYGPEDMIVYVDGSFNKRLNLYGAGMVVLYNGKKETFKFNGIEPDMLSMNNVAGEVLAAIKALEYANANKVKKVVLYHDYEGLEKFYDGTWNAKKSGTMKYQELCNLYSKIMQIEFVKVKAHSNDKYNDEADSLAKQAALI